MRSKRLLAGGAVALACGAGVAFAAHKKVDPATVPTGFFVAHNRVSNIPVDEVRRALRTGKTDVFVEHARLASGQATEFHRHPGPVFVTVARGAVTFESAVRGRCVRRTYGADRGFVEPGRAHRLVAGSAGADLYTVYLLPRLTGPHLRATSAPAPCS
jgi:quercetin dioxygenase-like cupin family protein